MPDEPMTNEPLPLPPSEPGVGLTQASDEAPAALTRAPLTRQAGRDDGTEEWVGPETQKAIEAL